MSAPADRPAAALSDRYRIERELGQGSMAQELVTEVPTRLMSLKRRSVGAGLCPAQDRLREGPVRPVAASAADIGTHPAA